MAGKRKTITWFVNESGCYVCTSHWIDGDGYPSVQWNGKKQHLHRALYEETHGPLGGLVARHKCDNRACINLAHIEPGSCKDNSNDMRVRNRCNTPWGEKRSDTKLTSEDVLHIRESNEVQRVLAASYGVHQSTISKIKSGQKRQRI